MQDEDYSCLCNLVKLIELWVVKIPYMRDE